MGKRKEKEKSGAPFFALFLIFGSIILVPLYIVYRMFVNMSDDVDTPLTLTTPEDRMADKAAEVIEDMEESMVVLKKDVKTKSTPDSEGESSKPKVVKSAKSDEISLSSRQQQMLDFISTNTEVDTSILHAKFKNVTVRTLRRDLKVLTDLGLIEKDGETKGATYKKS